jgi:hypothetical protein
LLNLELFFIKNTRCSLHFFTQPFNHQKHSAILSFLKRGCERTVNAFHYSFLGVPDRSALQPFTVPDRFLERSCTFHERFLPFGTFLSPEKLRNSHELFRHIERSGTLDSLKRSQNRVELHASKTKESLYLS